MVVTLHLMESGRNFRGWLGKSDREVFGRRGSESYRTVNLSKLLSAIAKIAADCEDHCFYCDSVLFNYRLAKILKKPKREKKIHKKS